MNTLNLIEKLRQHRPVLLACEAIGWLHMAGKARIEFLRKHGGDNVHYDDRKWHDTECPPFPWDDLVGWVKTFPGSVIPQDVWPSSMKEFTEKHRDRSTKLLGLLQAGHGVTSGIEKNLPGETSAYLGQSLLHMWLSSPFGYPKRNLSADPPRILTEQGWRQLVAEMRRVLEELRDLQAQKANDLMPWLQWREKAIGPGSYIREAFLSTLAETRLPNNDVTLWDQSYVAAALFKSAVAGAILHQSFPWKDEGLKQKTRWRLLTVAIGTDHYEARVVKIGDWTGTQAVLEEFFAQVAQLIEVDLAVGSLLYRDSSVAIFSFPGERSDESVPASWLNGWEQYLQQEIDRIAESLYLEIPPLVRLSGPTRSLVPMVRERREVAKVLAIPVHRPWNVCCCVPEENKGHVCPVCRVRLNGDPTNKGKPCKICQERRYHRLEDWLKGRMNYDTVWFEEVADRDDRIALITLSLDLEPWLNGDQVDSLRAQAIPEWSRYNPVLSEFWQRDESRRRHEPNPVRPFDLMHKLVEEIKKRFYDAGQLKFREEDLLLASLQEGYRHFRRMNPKDRSESDHDYEERLYRTFFRDIVEDRSDAPSWDLLNDDQRAAWFTHQLFRKLPSPGRVYRFWREAQEFFEHLLKEFRQIAACSDNPWRVRRVLIIPNQDQGDKGWKDGTLYEGRLRDARLSLVYVQVLNGFITASNLARVLNPEEPRSVLKGQTLLVEEEDAFGKAKTLVIGEVKEILPSYSHLGVYHPVIPLEVSPLRFRIIMPLEAASECVDLALNLWKERFARVWDRLPLHVGVVAFDRSLAFQAVLEATRNLEGMLASRGKECWKVVDKEVGEGVLVLGLCRQDGQTIIRVMPLRVPDGREDVFYPYFWVEDQQLRFPRDFRHPEGAIYRHVADLRIGDGVFVVPARVATLFMDSTAARFEKIEPLYAEDWDKLRALWRLLQRVAPSQAALQRFRSALDRLEREWQAGPDKVSSDLWQDMVRALLVEHLEVKGAALEVLTEATLQGLLQYTLKWHIAALKEFL
ncbi:MAG: CRISPR-associated protein Csx11 [Thermofilaceae archaeon]